ncbi:MAG: hypothetical protein HFE04_01925 [Bacilli bacterium]|nr:hypothetical protein [Bacilli bacterium]
MIKDLCFEIIEKCPNNCLFCSSCSNLDKQRKIDLTTFKKTIDYLMNSGGSKKYHSQEENHFYILTSLK